MGAGVTILRFVLILSLSANFCGRCVHFHDHDDESENVAAIEQLTSSEHNESSSTSCSCQYVVSEALRFHACNIDADFFVCDSTVTNVYASFCASIDLCGPEPQHWLSSRYCLTSTVLRC